MYIAYDVDNFISSDVHAALVGMPDITIARMRPDFLERLDRLRSSGNTDPVIAVTTKPATSLLQAGCTDVVVDLDRLPYVIRAVAANLALARPVERCGMSLSARGELTYGDRTERLTPAQATALRYVLSSSRRTVPAASTVSTMRRHGFPTPSPYSVVVHIKAIVALFEGRLPLRVVDLAEDAEESDTEVDTMQYGFQIAA